ncbi:hypothetical protein AS850_04930 [Frondihabitans sp. 762G35]|uniref:hypothetical protein n=1 Tax=Frondihabitans sp. 762G35 TaxID=1446794 RepID=UPI000D21C018|nr:hypothetical protein [Frondihabitans sp. 762G35]ARC56417.1 hypothetical protein AS850_04930 [Frondihabitans sp. 762G35]
MSFWFTLVLVEIRKATDTRAARWLLVCIAGLSVGAALLSQSLYSTFGEFVAGPGLPLTALLPIVSVLAMAGDWTQRTAMTTFALVPRRLLILSARLVAAVLTVLGITAVVTSVTGIAFAILHPAEMADTSARQVVRALGPVFALALSAALTGIAMGSLLLNTPLAIAVTLLVPFGYEIAITVAFPHVGPWISSLAFSSWLSDPHLTWQGSGEARGLGQALTSFGLWVIAPIALGWWRQLRKEVH